MQQRPPLYQQHLQAGAKFVEFAGWSMPLHYGSQLEEHHRVRRDAGVFDVSHMLVVDVIGARATDYLRFMLANDVARLTEYGDALYTCMLNERGGVIDDLIVYRLADVRYRLVFNAGCADKDLAWLQRQGGGFEVTITPRRDLAMLAVQGPGARMKVLNLLRSGDQDLAQGLTTFEGAEIGDWFVARTGYTGEDGFEIMLPGGEAPSLWRRLLDSGVAPAGLGARDTLRLEAGLNLYGQDMDETVTPLESGLGWTVAWAPAEREFIGRRALELQRERGIERKLVGLVLEARGVLRAGQTVRVDGQPAGVLTSGSFSPTLGAAIGLARVPASVAVGARVEVDIRGKYLPARVVKPPFVRHGQVLV